MLTDTFSSIQGTKRGKNLLARLSGQSFRYGKAITKDDNEEVILEFIRTAITKKSGDVVLLPLNKSLPSIPPKCRDYILVTEKKKEDKELSKAEKELIESRFSKFSSPVL